MTNILNSTSSPGSREPGIDPGQKTPGAAAPSATSKSRMLAIAGWLERSVARLLRVLLVRPLRAYFRYLPWALGKQFLWENLAEHLWWLETNVETTDVFGILRCVNARDIVGRYIYYFGIWEPNLTWWVRERLSPGDVFIDVGANVGYYSLLASELVGLSGKVVAIEPLRETFLILQHNLRLNHAANIRAINVAAWDVEETVTIFSRLWNPVGVTSIMPLWAKHWHLNGHRKVFARPLTDILDSIEARTARLIKIDVEGAEWRVIRGMEPILDDCCADLELVIELSPPMLQTQGKTCRDVFDLFEGRGFHPYQIDNSYLANSYFDSPPTTRPVRIREAPDQLFQLDVIFSRIDASSL